MTKNHDLISNLIDTKVIEQWKSNSWPFPQHKMEHGISVKNTVDELPKSPAAEANALPLVFD